MEEILEKRNWLGRMSRMRENQAGPETIIVEEGPLTNRPAFYWEFGVRVNHPTINSPLSPLVCVCSGSVLFTPRGSCLSRVGRSPAFQRALLVRALSCLEPALNNLSSPRPLFLLQRREIGPFSYRLHILRTCVLLIQEFNQSVEHQIKHRNNNGVWLFFRTMQPTKRNGLPLFLRT
jgi:hypothetical protein